LDSEQNRSAMPVEKGANRLVDIPADLIPTRFELDRDAFSLLDHLNQLAFIRVHSRFYPSNTIRISPGFLPWVNGHRTHFSSPPGGQTIARKQAFTDSLGAV
jgi:hypothetical protein